MTIFNAFGKFFAPKSASAAEPAKLVENNAKLRQLTALEKKYAQMFEELQIGATPFEVKKDNNVIQIQTGTIVTEILKKENKTRYDAVALRTTVPWYVVAVIHSMESGCDFKTHLHNGDPLTARTVHVPAGRPKVGNPPFTWIDSAADALFMKGWGNNGRDWRLGSLLDNLERYNGLGYRRDSVNINTPYLWAGSNFEQIGKYTSDGHFDPKAISQQIGAAVLLKEMEKNKVIQIPR